MDALGQAALVRVRDVSATELVDAAIRRIEQVNPVLNAVVTPMYERALDLARGEPPEGPFTGVPFLLKDLIATCAGVRHTEGSVFLRNHVSPSDSEFVRRLKQAGLVIVGKTNTPEFGDSSTTEPRLFGATRNPWDTERSPGGSSGGSAAAVAARLVPMAHGNDAGGSIRSPASCCGVFGLKPTHGRNPLDETGCFGFTVEHALTTSVRDSAALLDATSGREPERGFLHELSAKRAPMRIAVTLDFAGYEFHSDCVAAVKAASELCRELGHEVLEAAPAFDLGALLGSCMTIWIEQNTAALERWIRTTNREPLQEELEPLTWAAIAAARKHTLLDHRVAIEDLHRQRTAVLAFFETVDVWLTPTLAEPPLPLGTFAELEHDAEIAWDAMLRHSPLTPIANVTGQPAMSAPLYWNGEQLPIGTQFVGRLGGEATLFRLAAELEEAAPWGDRRPPVCA